MTGSGMNNCAPNKKRSTRTPPQLRGRLASVVSMHSNITSFSRRVPAILVALLLFGTAAISTFAAPPIKMSFLADPLVLQETLDLFTGFGCPESATKWFRRAVERYNAVYSGFDYTKFPTCETGFYIFDSVGDIISALPHPLCDTVHHFDMNCFDTTIAVTWGQMRAKLLPEQTYESFFAPHLSTKGDWSLKRVTTPRQAFELCNQSWYREETAPAFAGPIADLRVSLTAALFAGHVFHPSPSEATLQPAVLEMLQKSWQSQGIKFPNRFEVVLCHEVNLPEGWFVTAHAGLVFPQKKGFTYIEKAGGTGPFVRLDFTQRSELLEWLSAMFKEGDRLGYTHHFVTFNDDKIERLNALTKAPHANKPTRSNSP